MVAFVGFLFVALGIFLFSKGRKINLECEKYEFENRTNGGVIQFKDFKESKRHEAKKQSARIFGNLSMFAFLVGLILVFGGLSSGCH